MAMVMVVVVMVVALVVLAMVMAMVATLVLNRPTDPMPGEPVCNAAGPNAEG